ncbi:MAG: hypothetical protein Q8L43_03750, partial [Deltaproteobacteria bacterium]|nr:hypothetical protein [Deltaproteobacteria bacterium]
TMLLTFSPRQWAKHSPQVGKWLIQQVFGGTGFLQVTSKPIFGVILNQPRELKLGKNHPPLF